jgi:predicted dinucleotide-binding enzyme
MKIAILGTGIVGGTIGTELVQSGNDIMLGSRSATSEAGLAWLKSVRGSAKLGTFAEAAAFGDIVLDCTNGAHSLDALRAAGAENLEGKILIQVGNPLDFSQGMPPTLTVSNTDSLGEQTQREFPGVRVVKALNTVNCEIMVAPASLAGDHHLFICGNDAAAKADVTRLLEAWFGWPSAHIIDLGDISNARGTEMFLALWVRLWGALGTPLFNVGIVRAATA